jgi:hypothetical protein
MQAPADAQPPVPAAVSGQAGAVGEAPAQPVGPVQRPTLRVAVRIARQCQPNAWEAWRFVIVEVVADDGGFGDAPRLLHDDGRSAQWLFPGLPVTLFRDEAEGYHLNLSSGAPVWFVMWRIDDDDPSRAWPELVTLSYNEAGRLLDAQERVDNLPLPAEVHDWLQAYTDAHYRPEPKQRRRPASFRAPDQR